MNSLQSRIHAISDWMRARKTESVRLPLALLIASASACSGAQTFTPVEPPPHVNLDAAGNLPLSAVIGEDAAITALLWPDRWLQTRDAVAPLLNSSIAEAETLEEVVASMRSEWTDVIAALDGLDRTRPVVVRWGEAPDDLAAASAAAHGVGPNLLREVVVLPTLEPDRMERSLRQGIAVRCPTEGDSFVCSDGSTVRIEVRRGWAFVLAGVDDDALALGPTEPRSLTAVEQWAADASSAFALVLRPHRLRGAAVFTLARSLARRRHDELGQQRRLVGSFLTMTTHGSTFREVGFASDPVAHAYVLTGQLSREAQARFAAAGAATPQTPAPTSAPPASAPRVQVRSRVDLSGVLLHEPFGFGVSTPWSPGARSYGRLRNLADPLVTVVGESRQPGSLVFEQDASLPPGRIDMDIAPPSSATRQQPTLRIRSRIDGFSWSAIAGVDADAVPPVFNADAPPPAFDARALACLERYARRVAAYLDDSRRGPATVDEEQMSAEGACAFDGFPEEFHAYRAAFEAASSDPQ